MEYIAFYGSLMQAFDTQSRLKIRHQLQFLQPCQIHGQLFDLGPYPGIKLGSGLVSGELYEILDPRVLNTLDKFEGYEPNNRQASMYIRQCVRLAQPNVDAAIYVYQKEPMPSERIASGDWLQFHTP